MGREILGETPSGRRQPGLVQRFLATELSLGAAPTTANFGPIADRRQQVVPLVQLFTTGKRSFQIEFRGLDVATVAGRVLRPQINAIRPRTQRIKRQLEPQGNGRISRLD